MIEFERATFTYQGSEVPALREFSLKVPKGQCVVLCGRSGCGKSTALRLVNGMIPHFHDGRLQGRVSVCGLDPFDVEMWRLATSVGTVFQNPRTQFYTTDATSEVAFGCENIGFARAETARRVAGAFRELGIEHLRGKRIFDLSGGEKQLVAIASIVAMGPKVLVMDEPSSNLDLRAIEVLAAVLRHLKSNGTTILVAEHRLGYLKDVADAVVHMEKGRMSRKLSMGEVGAMERAERIETGIRPLKPSYGHRPPRQGQTDTSFFLTGTDIGYSYPRSKHHVLDIERFAVPGGRITALLGRNGAEKTTFTRVVSGLAKSDGGVVALDGRALNAKERLLESYVVMQDVNHQLFCPSVREEIILSSRGAACEERLAAIEAQLDVDGLRARHPMSLSGGQKQRVAIASALASEKRLLVLDEPTSGLDFFHMVEVADVLKGIASRGVAVLVVTHDMDFVAECCDLVMVLENGRVRFAGALDEGVLQDSVAYLMS